MTVAATSRPLRTTSSVTPYQSLVTTCEKPSGNSRTVTKDARRTSSAGDPMRLARYERHTAARPTSHTRYCGLITRLVTVNSSTAVRAASATVCGANRVARSRHSSSQPNATPVSASAAVLTWSTCGPRNSIEP